MCDLFAHVLTEMSPHTFGSERMIFHLSVLSFLHLFAGLNSGIQTCTASAFNSEQSHPSENYIFKQ